MIRSRLSMFAVSLTLLSTSVAADTITLRSSVRLPVGSPAVRLADVADLAGPHASAFADLVIRADATPDRPLELSINEIRDALDRAGAHWGHINLSGARVIIRPQAAIAVAAPQAMTAAALNSAATSSSTEDEKPEFAPATDLQHLPTLRGIVTRFMMHGLNVDATRLKLHIMDDHAVPLDQPIGEVRYEIKARSSFLSDRVTLDIHAWRAGRIIEKYAVRLAARVQADVLTARRDLARRDVLSADDVDTISEWITPARAAQLASLPSIMGQQLIRTVRTGEPILAQHTKPLEVIQRGEWVTVRCLVGGIAISLRAEALDDAAEGDAIQFRKLGEREPFTATVVAPGEAVVDLQAAPSS